MAARWGYGSNDFDGFILSPNGNIRATTDGRYAPVRPKLGVFAGAITLGGPGTDPPSDPVEPEPDITKTDASVFVMSGSGSTGSDGGSVPGPPRVIAPAKTPSFGRTGAYRPSVVALMFPFGLRMNPSKSLEPYPHRAAMMATTSQWSSRSLIAA